MKDKVKAKGKDFHSKGIWIKILIPALIVVAVAGIFIFKNPPQRDAGDKGAAASLSGQSGIQITDNAGADYSSADFDLDATENFDLDIILSYGLPVIIDFGSDSCIPCKEMAPVLVTMNAETRGKAIVKFVDVWKHITASKGFPVQVIPTQVFINADGTPYVPSDSMSDSGIEFTQYSSKSTNEHIFTTHQGGLTEEDMRRILADMGVPK